MTDQLVDRRDVPVFIHSQLDDLGLSTRAFRLYCHLARRAGYGAAWPSYQSMGDKCFGADNDNAETRRTWAIRGMNELVQRGLVKKELREVEGSKVNKTNLYYLTPSSDWVSLGSDGESLGGGDGVSPRGDGVSPKGIPFEVSPSFEGVVVGGGDDAERQKVVKLWEQNMRGMLTPIIVEQLHDLMDTYGTADMEYAIKEAVAHEARTLRYVTAILANKAAGKEKPSDARQVNGATQQGPAGPGRWVGNKPTNVDQSLAAGNRVMQMLKERLAQQEAANGTVS